MEQEKPSNTLEHEKKIHEQGDATARTFDGLLSEFNRFFEGRAEAVVKDGRLEVTVGPRTLALTLPTVAGGWSTGSSSPS